MLTAAVPANRTVILRTTRIGRIWVMQVFSLLIFLQEVFGVKEGVPGAVTQTG